jgi:hypothetical protein
VFSDVVFGDLRSPRIFLLGILICKGLTARHLYKSFGVKGLKPFIRKSVHIPYMVIEKSDSERMYCNCMPLEGMLNTKAQRRLICTAVRTGRGQAPSNSGYHSKLLERFLLFSLCVLTRTF